MVLYEAAPALSESHRARLAVERNPLDQPLLLQVASVKGKRHPVGLPGPADIARLKRGDIVTEFDSLPVTNPKAFDRLVRDTPAGREVKAVIWRDSVRREVRIAPVAAAAR